MCSASNYACIGGLGERLHNHLNAIASAKPKFCSPRLALAKMRQKIEFTQKVIRIQEKELHHVKLEKSCY